MLALAQQLLEADPYQPHIGGGAEQRHEDELTGGGGDRGEKELSISLSLVELLEGGLAEHSRHLPRSRLDAGAECGEGREVHSLFVPVARENTTASLHEEREAHSGIAREALDRLLQRVGRGFRGSGLGRKMPTRQRQRTRQPRIATVMLRRDLQVAHCVSPATTLEEEIPQRPTGRPVLGICVGMQVMFSAGNEHGEQSEGLDQWPGTVDRLRAPIVPHMGWSHVRPPQGSRLLAGIEDERFYFVHSYAVRRDPVADLDPHSPLDPPLVTWAEHGAPFVAAVENGALSATQFHPEKSGDAGTELLRNWLRTLR